jgi:hypothetical protein
MWNEEAKLVECLLAIFVRLRQQQVMRTLPTRVKIEFAATNSSVSCLQNTASVASLPRKISRSTKNENEDETADKSEGKE